MNDDRDVQEIAVDVLDDEREPALAEVLLARLADGASGRIRPERLVVGAAVVVAGEPEPDRSPENQRRGREVQERRPPRRLRRSAEPRVRRRAEQQRRVHRRQVRPALVVRVRVPGPGRIDDERRESGNVAADGSHHASRRVVSPKRRCAGREDVVATAVELYHRQPRYGQYDAPDEPHLCAAWGCAARAMGSPPSAQRRLGPRPPALNPVSVPSPTCVNPGSPPTFGSADRPDVRKCRSSQRASVPFVPAVVLACSHLSRLGHFGFASRFPTGGRVRSRRRR